MIYLVIALSIAGGELKIKYPGVYFEIHLNSLGEGIEKIINAINKNKN